MTALKMTKDLVADGLTHQELARLARAGELHRIRRGAYVAEAPGEWEDRDRHRLLLEATLRQSSPDAVASHSSAAVLHDLPTWNDLLPTVHLTRGRGHGGRLRASGHLHVTPLADEEVTEIDGLAVTSLARTVVDLGRSLSLYRSVPVADMALARGLRPDDLDGSLDSAARRVGVGSARRMAAFADGRSESVGESTSRWLFGQYGVPSPQLQYEVFDAGVFVARSDFGWEELRTLGEFDGKIKYGRLLKPGQSASDVVYAEKLREDALRDLGWQVVRWTWEDLARPRLLVARLHRAFDRGRR